MTDSEEFNADDDMINLITSKIEIDDKVYEKYSKMFDDKGTKEIYRPIDRVAMIVNDWEVSNAFNNISFEKATSWDHIPGLAFKEIFNLKEKDKSSFDNAAAG